MAGVVYEDILRGKVAMHNALRMHVRSRLKQLQSYVLHLTHRQMN